MSSLLFGKRKRETKVATLVLCMNDLLFPSPPSRNEPSPKKTRRRRRRRVFSSSKQSASSSAGRRRRQREGRCDFLSPSSPEQNGSQNRRLCVVEATEEENGGSANMSARELKRALEEMVRRRLVSNFSLLSLCLCLCVSFRIRSWRTRQRGRRRRLLGAGKRNVDD